MKIELDPQYRKTLLDQQRTRMGIGIRREGLHVSDLVMCVRKAWAERQTEFAENVDDNTILMFVRGLSHEDLFAEVAQQIRAGYCFQCETNFPWDPALAENEGRCPRCDDELLVGTIDWVHLEGDTVVNDFAPTEMKSTLKSSRQELVRDMPWYLDQLKSYLFMHGRQHGYVCVLHIMGDYARRDDDVRGNGPRAELKVYRCEWENDEERQAWGRVLDRRKQKVQGAIRPALDEDSPAHPYICDYCIVGERLPDGTQCENFPWNADGTRKGSRAAVFASMNLDQVLAELNEIGAANGVHNDA